MKISDYHEYQIHIPTSGGKAGYGCNKTSTIHVHKNGSIVKQFRFTVNAKGSSKKALTKARCWISEQKSDSAF